jgi:hypothetical protein
MTRQNPPQVFLDKAQELERLLRPTSIAAIYAIFGIIYAIVVGVGFGILVRNFAVNPTKPVVTLAIAIACLPMLLAILALFLAPHDPLSAHIRSMADSWRRPLNVQPDELVFRELLIDGEAICLKVGVYYPPKNRTTDIKERLYTYVNGALAKDFAMRDAIPTNREVEDVINGPLELLATEHGIPVLYSEIREVCKIRGVYDPITGNLAPAEPWRTGTY